VTVPFRKESEVKWESHSGQNKAKMKWIYTLQDDDSPITVFFVAFQKGTNHADHIHRHQPDLVYVLEGKGTFFMDGVGEFPMEPGMTILVPPNTLHGLRHVETDLLAYHITSPPTK